MVDTRTTLRYPIDLPGRLQIGERELSCRVTNLSLGGVFIYGPMLTIGTRVRLKLTAPHLGPIEVVCSSQWHCQDGSGLRFEDLHPITMHALARFIRHASRSTKPFPTDAVLRPPAT